MQSADVSKLVRLELNRVAEPGRRASLEALLIQPRKLSLAWEYGQSGERFDSWCVGKAPSGDVLLVYCLQCFGPSFPWGFVFSETGSLGNDGQWHSGLEDAAIGAGLMKPRRVMNRQGRVNDGFMGAGTGRSRGSSSLWRLAQYIPRWANGARCDASGVDRVFGFRNRWHRCAQPPATGWNPFGIRAGHGLSHLQSRAV
jgi:hypothetical protein